MFVRRLCMAALVGGSLFAGERALAGEPAPLALSVVHNQKLADTVADQLRQSGVVRQYDVDIFVNSGIVLVSGKVANQSQHDEVLRLIQGVPGVVRVQDQLSLISTNSALTPIQVPLPDTGSAVPPIPTRPPVPVPPGTPGTPGDPGAGEGAGGKSEMPRPNLVPGGSAGPGGAAGAGMPEPVPMHSGGGGGGYADLGQPRMPPYAWPSYAPYNNYSRVAYPNAYPHQAFPFIGPIYPFPKVPLGWRSVKLEWDDGYWWFGQVGNKYNWWKIRYW